MGKKNHPKVAVLLAAYNGMEWIEEQINSIFSQENVDITLFISVDQSTDGTELWVDNLAKTTENVVFLSYGERFGSAAANFIRLLMYIDSIDYDYISLADQDDIWFKEKLSISIESLRIGNAQGFSSDVVAFWPNGNRKLLKKSYPQCKYDYFFESPGPGCTFVLESEAVTKFQKDCYKYESYINQLTVNHDWFIYAYFRSSGLNWIIGSKPTMLYRQHLDNQVGINSGLKAYFNRFRLIKERWYKKQISIMLDSFCCDDDLRQLKKNFLLSNFREIRRRPRDKVLLFIFVLIGFLK